jgi:hypothetical protein
MCENATNRRLKNKKSVVYFHLHDYAAQKYAQHCQSLFSATLQLFLIDNVVRISVRHNHTTETQQADNKLQKNVQKRDKPTMKWQKNNHRNATNRRQTAKINRKNAMSKR